MPEPISFNAAKKRLLKKKRQGNGLCQEGFHKWQIHKQQQFDSKQGKLVTVFICARCKKQKTQLM